MIKKSNIDFRVFVVRLKKLREDVTIISKKTLKSRQPLKLDQTAVGRLSRMDALQSQAMQLEIDRRRIFEIQRIDSALQRVDEGEFGCCVSCGNEIELKRLKNDPATPICIDCAQLSEKKCL